MAQINKGTTFVTGGQVTADNLNNLVQSATLQPEAITGQAPVTTVADTHLLLTTPSTGASLNKVALSAIVSSLNLAKTNVAQSFTGNLTMAGGADITLTSGSALTLPSGASQTFAAGATLTLGQDPTANLQAVTKQYADNTFLKDTGGTVSGPLAVTGAVTVSNDITMTGASSVLTLSAIPTAAMHAATKDYVDDKTAFTRTPSSGTFTQGSVTIGSIIVKFGEVTTSSSSPYTSTITFATAFPTEFLTAYATGQTSTDNITWPVETSIVMNQTKSQMTVTASRYSSVYWLAIGR
jgi:hypothetical protein